MKLPTLLLLFCVVACIPKVPISGKQCNQDHPCSDDLKCCEGICLSECHPCPGRSCSLDWSKDCSQEMMCAEGCWEDCPSCSFMCGDSQYKTCSTGNPGESWRCRSNEICLVRAFGAHRTADCRIAAPLCHNETSCACLHASLSVSPYPACNTGEVCEDGTSEEDYVICRMPEHRDAGTADSSCACDAGTSMADAAQRDVYRPDHGVTPLDAAQNDASTFPDAMASPDMGLVEAGYRDASGLPDGATFDASSGDASSGDASAYGDAGSADAGSADAGSADAGSADVREAMDGSVLDVASQDAFSPDAGARDASSPDAGARDATVLDLNVADVFVVQPDAGALSDVGGSDAATPCGPVVPDCFEAMGTSPHGGVCCDNTAHAAVCYGTQWICTSDRDFATMCVGYGEECLAGTAPSCDANRGCLWSWAGAAGLHCTDFGPASPCVNNQWQCIGGSSPPESCDCLLPNCPR